MQFDFIDVNGLAGGMALGVAQSGGRLVARTGYLNLGAKIVKANEHLFSDTTWANAIVSTDDPNEWPLFEAPVVVAVPPCSGFSGLTGMGAAKTAGVARASADSPFNDCMDRTAQYVGRVKPDVYVFESVSGAWSKGRELMQQLRDRVEAVSGERYWLTHLLHDGISLGSPASRKRYLFVLTRDDGNGTGFRVAPHPLLEQPTTVFEAIGDLAKLPVTRGLQEHNHGGKLSKFAYDRVTSDGSIDGHWFRTTTGWVRYANATLEVCSGENVEWERRASMGKTLVKLHALDQADGGDRVYRCFPNNEAKANVMIGREFNFGAFEIVRWRKDGPGRVITGGGPMYTVHPTEPRNLTYRELARVMGYPDAFRIDVEAAKGEKLDAIWGKNVAVPVGKWVGESIDHWLQGDRSGIAGTVVGDRESLIDHLDDSRRLVRIGKTMDI